MTVGVGKPAICFRVTAGLSNPGSLGACFESHYNPVVQVTFVGANCCGYPLLCCCDSISAFWLAVGITLH